MRVLNYFATCFSTFNISTWNYSFLILLIRRGKIVENFETRMVLAHSSGDWLFTRSYFSTRVTDSLVKIIRGDKSDYRKFWNSMGIWYSFGLFQSPDDWFAGEK